MSPVEETMERRWQTRSRQRLGAAAIVPLAYASLVSSHRSGSQHSERLLEPAEGLLLRRHHQRLCQTRQRLSNPSQTQRPITGTEKNVFFDHIGTTLDEARIQSL
jgi:hypothetical protein